MDMKTTNEIPATNLPHKQNSKEQNAIKFGLKKKYKYSEKSKAHTLAAGSDETLKNLQRMNKIVPGGLLKIKK